MAGPGLDYLITWAMAGSTLPTASLRKQQVLDGAITAWVARGRPPQTINGKLLTYLRGVYAAVPGTVVRSVNAGTPGTFAPATATIPTAAALTTMRPPRVQITPMTPWPVSNYVVTADAKNMAWTGFEWVVNPTIPTTARGRADRPRVPPLVR